MYNYMPLSQGCNYFIVHTLKNVGFHFENDLAPYEI